MALDLTYNPDGVVIGVNGNHVQSVQAFEDIVDQVGGLTKTLDPAGVLLAVNGYSTKSIQALEELVDEIGGLTKTLDPAGNLVAVNGISVHSLAVWAPIIEESLSVSWSVDGPGDGYGVPNDSNEWDAVNEAVPAVAVPDYLYLCQEASGNLASSLTAATLTKFGTITYENAVTDWARKAIGLAHTGGELYNVTEFGDAATTSHVILAYIAMTSAPVGNQTAIRIGNTGDQRFAQLTGSSTWRAAGTGVTAVDGAANVGTTVHPVVLYFNRATSTFKVITDQEVISTTWVNPTAGGKYFAFGGTNVGRLLYAAVWKGAKAEAISLADVDTLLEEFGWTLTR